VRTRGAPFGRPSDSLNEARDAVDTIRDAERGPDDALGAAQKPAPISSESSAVLSGGARALHGGADVLDGCEPGRSSVPCRLRRRARSPRVRPVVRSSAVPTFSSPTDRGCSRWCNRSAVNWSTKRVLRFPRVSPGQAPPSDTRGDSTRVTRLQGGTKKVKQMSAVKTYSTVIIATIAGVKFVSPQT
jgi:hypothetical protein